MWVIEEFEVREVELDFTSSMGGWARVNAIYCEDTCLVNAVVCTELDADPVQMIVCAECGIVGCQSGGWLCWRRIGQCIVLLPAFAEMLEQGLEEYTPPTYVAAHGIPVFTASTYERLRTRISGFLPLANIKSLTAAEAVRLLQWDAPRRLLGAFPGTPQLIFEAILSVNSGELDEQCNRLQRFLDARVDSTAPLKIVESTDFAMVAFQVDGELTPWQPVADVGGQLAFYFELAGMLLV